MTIRELITELIKGNLDSEIIMEEHLDSIGVRYFHIVQINVDKHDVELIIE